MSRSSQRTGRGVNRGSLNSPTTVGETFPSNPSKGHIHTKLIGTYVIGVYKYNGATWDLLSHGIHVGTSAPTASEYEDMLWLDTN